MGKKKECYLQVVVETVKNRGSKNVVMTQKYWTVEGISRPAPCFDYFCILIKFESLTLRKRYIKEYADGRMMGNNYLIVRYASPCEWKDIPLCYAKPVTDKELADILGPWSYQKRFDELFRRTFKEEAK